MIRETFLRPALVFNAVVLSGISTVLALALYSIPQQVLRQGANDPQIQTCQTILPLRLEGGNRRASESVPSALTISPQPFAVCDCLRRSGQPLWPPRPN